MKLEEAIKHCEEVANSIEMEAEFETDYECYFMTDKEREECKECAADHRQLAEWLTELKELRKLTVINPIIAGYNEVYEKLRKGDIEASNDKDLLKTAVGTLENFMPKYRRLSEDNQKQKEQIAEYKRLLKAAVKCIDNKVECNLGNCDECVRDPDACDDDFNDDFDDDSYFIWKYRIEALALIGEEGENDA